MKCLDTYMQFTEESESPDSYHIWSAISGVAACLEVGKKTSIRRDCDLVKEKLG